MAGSPLERVGSVPGPALVGCLTGIAVVGTFLLPVLDGGTVRLFVLALLLVLLAGAGHWLYGALADTE